MSGTRIIFDTSGINSLEDGGSASELLMRGLESGFEVTVTGISVEEIIANKNAARRGALLSRVRRLLCSGKCVWPPHEIIRLLISTHFDSPAGFDWKKVDVRARDYEVAIARGDFDDSLCVEQRQHQFTVQKGFEKMWKDLRPHLDAIIAANPSLRPTSFHDAVEIAAREGGVLWTIGQGLYGRVAGSEPNQAEIKRFMDICPPFRAVCYGLVMAWYNGSLRAHDGVPVAGRNDLMAATYVPYCDGFITDDWAQRRNLREVCKEADIPCEILSVTKFDLTLAVGM